MDQNQTPTPQPDYSFIANQPGPNGELPGQAPKKPSSKKPIIAGILAFIIIIGAIGFFLVSKSSPSTPVANQNAQDVPTAFIQAMQKQDDPELTSARALVSPSLEKFPNAVYLTLVGLRNGVDFSTCKNDGKSSTDTSKSYVCTTKKNKSITLTVELEQYEGKTMVSAYKVKSNA